MTVERRELKHALHGELRPGALLLGPLAAKRAITADEVPAEAIGTCLPVRVGMIRDGGHGFLQTAAEPTTDPEAAARC